MKSWVITLILSGVVGLTGCVGGRPQQVPIIKPTAAQATGPAVTLESASSAAADEAAVRDLVQAFGARLKLVSLLAPTAAQDLQTQYAEFVSPELLAKWMSDVANAPGRLTSSPWPERIEITGLANPAPGRYTLSGNILEVTSVEAGTGNAAVAIPVQMVVEGGPGTWRITEFTQSP
jgi:hypothetical protein